MPCERLTTVLEEIARADSYNTIESIVNSTIETDEIALVLRLVELFTTTEINGFMDWLTELRASSDVLLREFPEEDWKNFQERFQIIQQFIPVRCIASHAKHENLQTVLGNQFQDVDIICDVRPIFNDTRDFVEDVIPVTTLKIRYRNQLEEVQVLEVVLSKENIDTLEEKIRIANKKWNVLRNSFSQNGQDANIISSCDNS